MHDLRTTSLERLACPYAEELPDTPRCPEVPLSTQSADQPAEQRFRLSARPPVRALGIASVAATVGAILLVVTVPAGWPTVVMIIGGALMVLGVALAGTALIATRRLRSVLLLGPAGLAIVRQGRTRTVPWAEVDNVTLQGARLVFSLKGARPLTVINPPGSSPAVFNSLLVSVQQRLDADRGYRNVLPS